MTGIERCKKHSYEPPESKEKKRLQMFDTFMKVVVFVIVIHGLSMITLSYILAFMDKVQIAEELSKTVVTEIIAPITVYGITKTIENVSKYNNWVETIVNKEDADE